MTAISLPEPGTAHTPRAARLVSLIKVLLVLVPIAALLAGGLYIKVLLDIRAHQAEAASNAAVSTTAVADLAATEKDLMAATGDGCGPVKSLIAWIGRLSPEQRQSMPHPDAVLNSLNALCAFDRNGYVSVDRFLASYAPAVVARQNGDFAAAAADYAQALKVTGLQPDYQVRALEGLAYSQMKLEDLGAAQKTIGAAEKLKTDYVFTQITGLKIACRQHAAAADVRAEFQKALEQRDVRVAKTRNDAFRGPYAVSDRKLLLEDPELRLMCGYAHLPPQG